MKGSGPLRIYIAGPYTAPTRAEVERNVRSAIDIGVMLIRKGHFPFIPHLSHYIDIRADKIGMDLEWADYMRCDLSWLSVSDALFFRGSSPGADVELKEAERSGLTIFYSLSEVPHFKYPNNDIPVSPPLLSERRVSMPAMRLYSSWSDEIW